MGAPAAGKKPADLKNEQWWQQELTEAGYDPEHLERKAAQPSASLDDLAALQVASRALDRCVARSSAWTRHIVQEHVTRITTEAGVQTAPAELREFIGFATDLATSDCFSFLPPGAPTPKHVAHLTSLGVVAAETALRGRLTAATPRQEPKHPDVAEAAHAAGLDAGQTLAAAAVASTDPLVIVEGRGRSREDDDPRRRHRSRGRQALASPSAQCGSRLRTAENSRSGCNYFCFPTGCRLPGSRALCSGVPLGRLREGRPTARPRRQMCDDLTVVRQADRIGVMYLRELVEVGAGESAFARTPPLHPRPDRCSTGSGSTSGTSQAGSMVTRATSLSL